MKISRSIIAPLVLTILASALYRIMPNRPMGFAPQIAIALFSGALCVKNKKWAFAMPLVSMFISDLFFEVLYMNHLTDYQGFYSGQWLNYILIAGLAAFGFLIQTKAQSVMSATVASVLLATETPFAVFFGLYFHSDPLTLRIITGGLLVMLAMALVIWSDNRKSSMRRLSNE